SGLLSDDEIAFSGPLSRFVSGDTVAQATAYHAHWGQYLLYALVALHLLAILFYAWRGRGLVRAMVTGDKHLPEPLPSSRDTAASRLLALVLALVAGAAAWWVQQLGGAF
ncbi:MAG: cytochrome b/b6 domain-containing protein, partial [Delftia acidovorans]|nr:cytochrome b/b6 domain-containing protein [Delftia acidovorans]